MTTRDDRLQSEIERLYMVFGAYTLPVHPTYCHCCVASDEDQVLCSKPLRQLSAEELQRYSWKAITTWGTVEQFKYFLPRLFELVATGPYGYNPEVLFQKPRLGEIGHWPSEERAALNSYCDALWRAALAHHPLQDTLPAFPSIEDCLRSIAQIADDLIPFLNMWDLDKGTAATSHLVDLAVENAEFLREAHQISGEFWQGRETQRQQVVDWLFSREFSLVLDVVDPTATPWEFRQELTRAILERSHRQS